ncbi:Myb family Dna-binding domain-containing protein, partial [Cardiosporidium cionae]
IPAYEGAYKRTKSRKWSSEDISKFYQAIEMFGTDLMMVQIAMPEFTDKQIRDKFKAEEKRNYLKVEAALKTHREIKLPAYEEIS